MLVGEELISLFICFVVVVVVSLMLLYLFYYVQYIFCFILFTGSLMGLFICLFIYLF